VILPSIGLIGAGSPALHHCSHEDVLSVSQTIEMLARGNFGRSSRRCTSIDHSLLKK